MPKPALPNLHVPLAVCALFALGACLDHSGQLTGQKDEAEGEAPFGIIGDDRMPPPELRRHHPGMFGPDFGKLPIQNQYDSSLKAFRMLKAQHGETYTYTTESNPIGAPAVSLDSLYALCLAHLPDTLGGMNWFSLDSNYILSQCGSYEGTCAEACPPQVSLTGVEWPQIPYRRRCRGRI